MTEAHLTLVASELGIAEEHVRAVEELLAEGATIPFIARYRKERTGSLDEVALTRARDRLAQLAALDKRREVILNSLQERELLTDELRSAIEEASTLAVLEDIYLPYRPKRRTRATVAREKGLEPLAQKIFTQEDTINPLREAAPFVNAELGVASTDDALAGARDIIAEWVNEDAETRQAMRQHFARHGALQSKAAKDKEEEGAKYRDYFDWRDPVPKAPSHRVLAMFRGEAEGYLKLSIRPPEEEALEFLLGRFVKGHGPASQQVALAVEDSYGRLLGPSMETEVRHEIKERADDEAIRVFAQNLRQCLMAPPLGQKAVLAIDPGYRTGCKVACLDRQGKLLDHTTIFITQSAKLAEEAAKTILRLVERFHVEAIAIGNGTASRETEAFVRGLNLPKPIPVVMVNESGASVYSASQVAREEFPDEDVTVRGAVSIGRRLMDPLAELVKIDPKSIGVGQYQHDVDQGKLKGSLDEVVMSCVGGVGVEVNTASKELLTYVPGLGPALAKNIVAHRNENGPFRSRDDLKKIPRLGPKAFEQAAGFLRIRGGGDPLDASAVHPESYPIVERMAQDLGCTVQDLMRNEGLRQQIDLKRYVSDTVGLPTLTDILEELARPGRDPRDKFETFSFAEGVNTMDDLVPGMKLPGIVTNVTKFGAFVDIGVHQDGLVHISRLADRFVKDPTEVVKVNQKVTVTVLEVDKARGRISLSMRQEPQTPKIANVTGKTGD
ncbi:MAG: RNA-binding transcriptional accessory protein [Chloroflexi bacterium]|nr:RNA-binding transcriptional accessory protein [Chloroflexota bacterium]